MRYARIPIVLVLALCLCSCSIQPLFDWDVLLDLPLDGGQDEIKRENPMLDELHFSLPDSDIEEFYAGLSQCKAIYEKCHKSYADELEDALYELEWLLSWFSDQRDVTDLLLLYDTADEQARQNDLYAQKVYTQLHTDYWNAINDMKRSSNPLTPTVVAFLDEVYPNRMPLYYDNDEYETRMTELESAFSAYNGKGSAEKVHDIYVEYVEAANLYAKSYGYDNYYECASDLYYRRNYGKEERDKLRAYVKEYLVPLYREYDRLWESKRSAMSFWERMQSDRYHDDSYDTVAKEALFAYFDSLPEGVGEAMRVPFDENKILYGDRSGSVKTAMVTTLGEEYVCYFHEDFLDLVTVAHEMGHYYANTTHGTDADIAQDLKEAHSQTSSLLMLRYLRDEIGTEAFAAYELYEVGNLLYQAISSTIKDEFDEIVFSLPDVTDYTVEQLNEIMEGLIEKYGIGASEGDMRRQLRTYWHRQGIDRPAYFISYGVSAVVAMEIYHKSENDYAAATECYQRLVERSRAGFDIDAVAVLVGLHSPFDEQCYEQLADIHLTK